MRRTLIVLAVLLAGSWGDRAIPRNAPAAELHQLADAAESGPLAFLRAGSTLPLVAWQDGSVSPPRAPSRSAARRGTAFAADSESTRSAFITRERRHREHTARLGLLRAGRSSFHTATPPPFRSV